MPSRRPAAWLGGCLLAALFFGSFATVRWAMLADLHTPQDLPPDVRTEVDDVWDRFNVAFASQRRCFDDVTVRLVGRVEGGDARYIVDDAAIEIDIPTSPKRFRESLAHELAHHVEHTCAGFGRLRSQLAVAMGASGQDWFRGETWETTPSEVYAEAVVELVNGSRVRHVGTVIVAPEVLDLIAAWAS